MGHSLETAAAGVLGLATGLAGLLAETTPETLVDAGGGSAVLLLAYLLNRHLTKLESRLDDIESAMRETREKTDV